MTGFQAEKKPSSQPGEHFTARGLYSDASSPLLLSYPVLRIRIREPGSGAFLTPGSEIRDAE